MHSSLAVNASSLYAFLLVLTRVAGVFVFVPLPGLSAGFELPRIVFSVAVTIVLSPAWPAVAPDLGLMQLLGYMAAEAAFGLTLGVAISFIAETVMLGFQILSLQAGFGYASMIDPTTQNESGVLVLLARLMSGLVFFLLGFDRIILKSFIASFAAWPPGSFSISQPLTEQVTQLGSAMFSAGLRLVLPAVGLLAMIDIAMALIGKMHAQLQLMALLFPAKILVTLAVLSASLVVLPRLFSGVAEPVFRFIQTVAGG